MNFKEKKEHNCHHRHSSQAKGSKEGDMDETTVSAGKHK